MANATFFQNLSDKNVINKNLVHLPYGNNNIVSVDIKAPCSSEHPTIMLGSASFDFRNCNYFYLDTTGRYYFIDDIILQNNGIVEIYSTVDVLESFKGGILSLQTVIERQESESLCNKFIPDPLIVSRIDRVVTKKQIGSVGGNAAGRHITLTVTGA